MDTTTQSLTLTLPSDVVQLLARAAARRGSSIEEVGAMLLASAIRRQLAQDEIANGASPTPEERAADWARLMSHAGAVNLGYPLFLNNEEIDEALAREYESTHEDEL